MAKELRFIRLALAVDRVMNKRHWGFVVMLNIIVDEKLSLGHDTTVISRWALDGTLMRGRAHQNGPNTLSWLRLLSKVETRSSFSRVCFFKVHPTYTFMHKDTSLQLFRKIVSRWVKCFESLLVEGFDHNP